MDIVENSAEDLLLRGFNQSEILDRTGIDVGYHGNSFYEKLSGIDRVDYKVDFVKKHYTKQQLLDVLDEYANGLDKEEVLHRVGISGINIIRLKVLFDKLGLQGEFKTADSKHRRLVMTGGMVKKYGVDNPFKLQQFQDAGQNTRESKYGAKFTLAKGSVFAKEARKKINNQLKDDERRKEINDKRVATMQERYGVDHPMQSEAIKKKIMKTSLERYGVDYPMQSDEMKKKMVETSLARYGVTSYIKTQEFKDKSKATCLRKYGVENYMQLPSVRHELHDYCCAHREERKQVFIDAMQKKYGVNYSWENKELLHKAHSKMLERYGAEYYAQSEEYKLRKPEITKRTYDTLKTNGTYKTSTTEKLLANISNFEQQYYDDRYPYLCDFYDKNTDAFIEINASWVHGRHWFGSDENDSDYLDYMKQRADDSRYYASAIGTWTQSDVEKRECARESDLNYITFWDAKGSDADLWMGMGCPKGHDYDYEYSWLPDRKIAIDVDISKMRLSIGKLSTVVKDAQRGVFYEHELALWNNNAYRGDKWGTVRAFLYANRWKYIHKLPNELTDRMLLRAFRISGLYVGYTSFDNAMMLKVIEKYGVTSVYDPCSGWGERMVTCGLLGVDYEGCDINDRLTNGYNKLIGLIDGFKPLMHINDSAKQDVEHDVDAIITCPPYMDVEIYTDKGAEHYDVDEFKNWWEDVVAKCSATNAKVFAVQTNQACRDIFLSGMEGAGWKLSEELTYNNARVSHFHRTGKSVKHEFESMLVMTR